jgi:hypothetical protein
MLTPTAILACIGRVYFNEGSTSFFRFVEQHAKETRPSRVTNAFGKAMIMNHTVNLKVFHTNDAVAVNYLPALLVREVVPFVGYSFMHPSDGLTPETTLLSSLFGLGEFALNLSQLLFFSPKEAGIFNHVSIGEGSKSVKPNVYANRIILWGQSFRFYLATEANEPLTCCRSVKYSTLRRSLYWTVQHNLDMSNLGNVELAILEITSTRQLREGDTIVSTKALEAGVSRLLTCLNPTKESFHCQIYPDRDVLQYLGMNLFEGGSFFFEERDSSLLVKVGDTFTAFFPGFFSLTQKVIEQPTALFKGVIKQASLLFCRVHAVLESFQYIAILA